MKPKKPKSSVSQTSDAKINIYRDEDCYCEHK